MTALIRLYDKTIYDLSSDLCGGEITICRYKAEKFFLKSIDNLIIL